MKKHPCLSRPLKTDQSCRSNSTPSSAPRLCLGQSPPLHKSRRAHPMARCIVWPLFCVCLHVHRSGVFSSIGVDEQGGLRREHPRTSTGEVDPGGGQAAAQPGMCVCARESEGSYFFSIFLALLSLWFLLRFVSFCSCSFSSFVLFLFLSFTFSHFVVQLTQLWFK